MKIKILIAMLTMSTYISPVDRVVFKSLAYTKIGDPIKEDLSFDKPEQHIPQKLHSYQSLKNIKNGSENYNQVEGYLKCMACACFPFFWAKASTRNKN